MPQRRGSNHDTWPTVTDRVWKQITHLLPWCPLNHWDALYDDVQSDFCLAAQRGSIVSPPRFADTITRRRIVDHVRHEAPLIPIVEGTGADR